MRSSAERLRDDLLGRTLSQEEARELHALIEQVTTPPLYKEQMGESVIRLTQATAIIGQFYMQGKITSDVGRAITVEFAKFVQQWPVRLKD